MGKTMVAVCLGLIMLVAGASGAYALQAGGVEIGDLDTGSVVGQPFKELIVDGELFAVEIGNLKAWYPPITIIDFKVRPGRPVVLKVTNSSTAEHGFQMTDLTNEGSPFVMKAEVVLKPGDQIHRRSDKRYVLCHARQYLGVPLSFASGSRRRQNFDA